MSKFGRHGLFALLTLAPLAACGSDSTNTGPAGSPAGGGTAGVVTSDDGRVTLDIPASAGVDPTTIRIRARTDLAALPNAAFAYDMEPDGLQFAEPVKFSWKGPVDAMGGELTQPDLSRLDIPLLALRSRHKDDDPAPEALTEQAIALDLDTATATFEGKLEHFSNVAAEQPGGKVDPNAPDHEKFAGHFAVGFMGLQTLPFGNGAAGTINTPIVGMRFWVNKQIGIEAGLGFGYEGKSVAPGEEVYDTPEGTALQGGVPIVFAAGRHYKFSLFPTATQSASEIDVALAVRMGLRAATCPASSLDNVPRPDVFLGLSTTRDVARACGKTVATPGTTAHSNGVLQKVPEGSTDVVAADVFKFRFLSFAIGGVIGNSLYHCGARDVAFTVCPNPATVPAEGDFFAFDMLFGAAVPTADPTNRYTYSFVLDADDNTGNNYMAPVSYPKDFYDNTDRWYEASYTPGPGWTLTAKDAHGPSPTVVATAARMVIKDNAMMLIVPKSEISAPNPKWRATSFRHKGDYGLQPPNDWSGDVVPPVGQLANTP